MTMDRLADLFSSVQQWLFEALVGPLVFSLGWGIRMEDAFDATRWLLVGLAQMVVLLTLGTALQRWRPAQVIVDRAAVRVDIIYTIVHRLGLFRLGLFFTLTPLLDDLLGRLRVAGLGSLELDAVWPGVTDRPWVSLVLYLLAFDLLAYWIHRGQHHFEWWWRLHALHHSQRQLTMWSDNRNHLLDDVIVDVIVVMAAYLIGVAPGQFVAIVALTQLSESLQHANVRLWFGRWGERLWISPRYHRLHHSVGVGHESPLRSSRAGMSAARPPQGVKAPAGGSAVREATGVGATLGGHNFGVLLPWWDMLFGTANFELRYDPTGVRDQVEQGRAYGEGFWSQQWLGILRLLGRA